MEKNVEETVNETVAEELPKQEGPEPASEPDAKEEDKKAKKAKAGKNDKKIEKLEAERDDYKNALIRERADFENYKKRNAVSTANAYADGQAATATEFLPVLDNLERALVAAAEEDSPLKTGVEMVLRQMTESLAKLGIEEIACLGQPFDPNVANAVMQVEPEEGDESGMVKEVLLKGFKIKDRILRHAMVKVVK